METPQLVLLPWGTKYYYFFRPCQLQCEQKSAKRVISIINTFMNNVLCNIAEAVILYNVNINISFDYYSFEFEILFKELFVFL